MLAAELDVAFAVVVIVTDQQGGQSRTRLSRTARDRKITKIHI